MIRCIWCDDSNHKRSDCGPYADALKKDIDTFREDRIRDATTDEPLGTNFERGSMKKLLEEMLDKSSFIQAREVHTYHIETSQSSVEATSNTSREVLIRRAQAIRELTRWVDLIDIIIIKAYLVGDHSVDISTNASVEVKRSRATEDEETEELVSKKKSPNSRGAVLSGKSPADRTR